MERTPPTGGKEKNMPKEKVPHWFTKPVYEPRGRFGKPFFGAIL